MRRTVASGFHEVRREGGREGGGGERGREGGRRGGRETGRERGRGDRMRRRTREWENKGMGEQEVWSQQEFLLHRWPNCWRPTASVWPLATSNY